MYPLNNKWDDGIKLLGLAMWFPHGWISLFVSFGLPSIWNYEWKILNQFCCVVFIIQLYVYSILFFSYNRHKVIEKKIKLQISLIKLLSLVYRVLVTNHRVEFFEPIFSLKFVTFLPLTFAKTFLGPWELLPLIIYIPPSPNIFYTSNVV